MNNRENFISIVKRTGYEHMPVSFNLCASLIEQYHLHEKTNEAYSTYFNMTERQVGWQSPINNDASRFEAYYPTPLKPGTTIDDWGVGNEPGSAAAKHMTRMLHPMANFDSLDQIKAYPFPKLALEAPDAIKEATQKRHAEDLIAVGNMQCTIWETAWYMRGMENLMMDMLMESEMAEYLLDVVTTTSIIRAQNLVKAGVDVLFLGDDIGMQKSIMMSHELYATWLKPRLKRVIDAARAINPNIIIFYHSCGYVKPFIQDFIDIGIDVLNPVQPECMDFREIHEEFGDKISFHGTIGTQTTMPFKTPTEIKREVYKNLEIAGDKGGLLVAPTHLLEPEVPWENILAYVQACRSFK
ncbi:MAG: uroporphyrinogen decarboxylase family protein [Cellulosilyticaceae bacterium]